MLKSDENELLVGVVEETRFQDALGVVLDDDVVVDWHGVATDGRHLTQRLRRRVVAASVALSVELHIHSETIQMFLLLLLLLLLLREVAIGVGMS